MIKTYRTNDNTAAGFLARLGDRADDAAFNVDDKVKEIIAEVRSGGDKAVLSFTEAFDKVKLDSLEIPRVDIEAALENSDKDFLAILSHAITNIRAFHEKQKQNGFAITKDNGCLLGQRVRGLDRVGLYVPGGTAAYPSSVVMNAIPAKVAGVKELILVTPPSKNGKPNPDILAAAALCGVDRVFLCGGAQAVAALAYGTESVPKVSKIVGPGNRYVAAAKRLLYGIVDIDMVAGPSEIAIIADKNANPIYIAADLMSQAEHDAAASAVLFTDSEELAKQTAAELERVVRFQPRSDIITASLAAYGGIVVTKDVDETIRLVNNLAPEHLEVLIDNPVRYLGALDNAGSVFLGEYSPEPLGDYFAGPNHVLPTCGTARFFSPLSVDAFVKKSSYIYYTKDALMDDAAEIIAFAKREGLYAHGNSIAARVHT
ncbi:MAG: histidinol dehydrogenase [Oscillospiraceae bacterium]|jgi:histidinol dehydrogenase|nr:histidinol dehydrogenase [Oscillospiraceae bacterium]